MFKIIILIGAGLSFAAGCAVTQHLPSVTLGGKANKDKLLGVDLGRDGLTVVAPLVEVEIPPLGLDLGGGDGK